MQLPILDTGEDVLAELAYLRKYLAETYPDMLDADDWVIGEVVARLDNLKDVLGIVLG